ncbi:MAG: substrate-binding domain-containing protein [Lachnospiraceae bacterium]
MKRLKYVFLILAAVSAVLTGCGEQELGTQETNTIRIGVSVYRWDDTFITGIRTALEEQAKLREQETGTKIVLDIMDAKESQNTQNSQVERLISLGCDVLCINIVDRYTASNIIDKAMAADIPVVFFNREPVEEDMERWEKLYYIGTDPKESAVLQGQILVDAYREDPGKLDKNGDGAVSYVLLEGESSHQDSLIRTEWSIQTVKDGGVPLERLTGGIANWERSRRRR